MDKEIQSFREKLEAVSEWPSIYMFKFIVKVEQEQEVKDIFRNHDVISKPSKNGTYVSLTINIFASSADQIIDRYIETSKIKGIISL